MPAAVAAGLPETTTPWLPTATLGPRWLTGVLVAWGQAKDVSKKKETAMELILRMRDPLRFPFSSTANNSFPQLLHNIPLPLYSTHPLSASQFLGRVLSLS